MQSSNRAGRERGLRNAVLAGDEQAWHTWYDESFAGLTAYVAWRCSGLRDIAEEVVQETWLTAVKRIRSFDPDAGSFQQWLRGIAANLLRNHFRRDVRRNGHLNGRYQPEPIVDASERHASAEAVARALAELPEHYESVLRSKYLDGQSVADIAAARNETPKAIESLLTRARQAFRAAYTQDDEP